MARSLQAPSTATRRCWRCATTATCRSRFVPQESLPEGTAYEEFISATGNVPTRDNLHDFFNGLVWQTFPLIKRELNALQAAQIAPPAA